MSARRPRAEGDIEALAELGCACASARRLARTLTQLYDRRLRQADIEAPQFAILSTLRQGPCSQTALGRRHALDKATVSRNLRGLADKGWITIDRVDDRRMRQVSLTPAGQQRLSAARKEWERAQADLQAALTGTQWRTMFATFRAVTAASLTLQRSASRRSRP